MSLIPVILSGGSGSRLWPLSRESFPKQLLSLTGGGETLLQSTIRRVAELPMAMSPLVVCNESHRFLVAEQLRQIDVLSPTIVLESVGRNTAPAIAVAAQVVRSRVRDGTDPLLLVLPADHVVRDSQVFNRVLQAAIPAAQAGRLVTFGVVPQHPETGYGYIRCRADRALEWDGLFRIEQFVEKPDRATAERYIAAGDYLWNSGMFLFKASVVLDELARHAPDIERSSVRAVETAKADLDFLRIDAEAFSDRHADSIDYAVMEKTDRAVVAPLDAGWSDVGSWSSLHETIDRDSHGNALRGDVIAEDTTDSLVLAESRLVATVGLTGHIVVETKDAVLVVPKERVQDVKKLFERLKRTGRPEHQLHREVHRPWGSYDTVEIGKRYQVKRLSVKPGASMSLQLHHHRAEHWVVVSGRARITRGDEIFFLEENQSTYIPLGERHRIENPDTEMLHIIEVQSGEYLGEDDIVRLEDRYGRDGFKG